MLWLPGGKNSRSLVHRNYFRIYAETYNMLQTSGLADKTFLFLYYFYDSVHYFLLRTELEGYFTDNRFWSDLDSVIASEVKGSWSLGEWERHFTLFKLICIECIHGKEAVIIILKSSGLHFLLFWYMGSDNAWQRGLQRRW